MSVNSSRKRSKTNWKKVESLPDSKIDYSDIPELDSRFFQQAIRWPGRKLQITLRLDPDVLAFFRQHGKGYQTTINSVLRRYVESQRDRGVGRSR
ncbi:MAG: 3-oxoacyl-ACP synthase [Acidobacteria bacterium]|nr:MAG: 3-oxoacyl-ACP synthase [Acidobacteriota bacterium]